MHKDDRLSVVLVRQAHRGEMGCLTHFKRIEDDIQFDGVLTTNRVIYLARIGKRYQYQNGDQNEKGAEDVGLLCRR